MIITCGCSMTVSRSFASSHRTKTLRHVPETSRRTGLTLAFFFDSCVAWREGENSDTVVLVEFKKPMRDNYTVGRDPVQQVFHYVKLLRTEKAVPDIKGRAIRGVKPNWLHILWRHDSYHRRRGRRRSGCRSSGGWRLSAACARRRHDDGAWRASPAHVR